jgi:hypothetical protein
MTRANGGGQEGEPMLKNDNKKNQKLTLTTVTVKKLRDQISDDQLREVVGGAPCPESGGSRTVLNC